MAETGDIREPDQTSRSDRYPNSSASFALIDGFDPRFEAAHAPPSTSDRASSVRSRVTVAIPRIEHDRLADANTRAASPAVRARVAGFSAPTTGHALVALSAYVADA